MDTSIGRSTSTPTHRRELYRSDNHAPHTIFAGFHKALRWLAEGRIATRGLTIRVDAAKPARIDENLIDKRISALFVLFDWHRRLAAQP